MTSNSAQVLTYDDYRRLPDDGKRYEILDGQLNVTPAPNISHQRISRNLLILLHKHVEQKGIGEVFAAPLDVVLSRIVVVEPDLVFVAKKGRAAIGKQGISGPPNLVVEILSPGTKTIDRSTKRRIYARCRVKHYWIIDPVARLLTEMSLQDRTYQVVAIHHATAKVRTRVFPTLRIDLTKIFKA